MMKRIFPISLIVVAVVAVVAFDQYQPNKEISAMEQRIQELEEKTSKDLARQKELEQELASHRLAMEWASIERERKEIEARRADLESNGNHAKDLKALNQRDKALASRERLAEGKQAKLIEDQLFAPGGRKLPSEAKFPLAGLEAGAFAEPFDATHATIDSQYFDEALSPYGTWYDTVEYGSVWQPAVCREPDWRPYTRGQWVCSDRGWTWVSTEPFGWATYHYGRWALLQNRGWIWVPGTTWAPNWCTWRSDDTYIGWAPLPPETLVYQNCEWDSRVEKQYGIGASCFSFVRARHFDHSISRYCLPANRNPSCLNATTNITRIQITNGQIFCGGPGYHDLSERLGRRLPYYQIHRYTKSYAHHNPATLRSRVKGDRLIVAAPTIQKTRPIIASRRLTGVKAERSNTFDPQVLDTYRQMRKRETHPPTVVGNTPGTSPRRRPVVGRPISQTENSSRPNNPATQPPVAQVGRTVRPSNSRPTTTPSAEANRAKDRQKAEAQLQAFREMARGQRAIASAERVRREKLEIAANKQKEETSRRQRSEQAERQKVATQQTQREEIQRRGQEEAQQKQRDEQQRQRTAEQRKQVEEKQRRQQEEAQQQQREEEQRQRVAAQRRQREEAQRRSQEQAQRKQREEQQRQRADEQRKQQEQAQRRQQEQAQRQQREETQRRSQEEAQRRQRDEQQRQREQGQRRQRGK